MVHVLLKPVLENFEHYFASVWDECNCVVVWVFFGIAFLWDWNENWPFVWLCVTPWIVASTLLCPWDLPGQNSEVGSYSLLQFPKNISFCFIEYAKAFDYVDHNKLENSSWDGNTRPPDLPVEKSMQVRKQQLEIDMEQQTGSNQGKDYVKAVICHPVYLT